MRCGVVLIGAAARATPQPASPAAVRHDLGLIIAAVVVLGNAFFLRALVLYDENAPLGAYILLAGNLSAGPVLWWARSSITKAWAGSSR